MAGAGCSDLISAFEESFGSRYPADPGARKRLLSRTSPKMDLRSILSPWQLQDRTFGVHEQLIPRGGYTLGF